MFSDKELGLLQDQYFLLQKRKITDQLIQLLHEVEEELKKSEALGSGLLPNGILKRGGKISRGENYKGLPYLVLDFPRFSMDGATFIYRTMFWWGNYFICMLISENCGHHLIEQSDYPGDLICNTGSTPWNYDLNTSSWVPLTHSFNPTLNHITIARKIELKEYSKLPAKSRASFELILSFLDK